MQTRRDQLQAYRFVNRRALAALVIGEPDVVEPPMRRLTITTISGIMIAILIAAGFALFGVLKPTPGNTWKNAGAIIVERETGARYVLINNELHPALNYSSAVLALPANQNAHVVEVARSDLKNAKRGPTIGIDGLPDSLPAAHDLVTSPWTVCSRQHSDAGTANQLDAQVSVLVGDDAAAHPVAAGDAVVVRAVNGHQRFLLFHGQRLAIADGSVATALGLGTTDLLVGTAFLGALPQGTPLRVPVISGVGTPGSALPDGQPTTVGQLLHTTDTGRFFVVLRDGVLAVNPLQTALLQALAIVGPNHRPVQTLDTTATVANNLGQSGADAAAFTNQFVDLPDTVPSLDPTAASSAGICAVYRAGSAPSTTFAVPPSTLPANPGGTVVESEQSRQGRADTVVLAPGRAALVKSDDTSATVLLIAAPGKKFAAASADVVKAFGYGSVTPVTLPAQLLPLFPDGPALDPAAIVLNPTTGRSGS